MTLEVEILTGRYKGDTAIVENYFSSLYNVRVAEGDKISIRIDTTGEDEYQVSVYNYYRVPQMIGCIVAFVLLLVLIGGKKVQNLWRGWRLPWYVSSGFYCRLR